MFGGAAFFRDRKSGSYHFGGSGKRRPSPRPRRFRRCVCISPPGKRLGGRDFYLGPMGRPRPNGTITAWWPSGSPADNSRWTAQSRRPPPTRRSSLPRRPRLPP